MPITYGLTDQGFVTKPTTVIASEVDTALKGILGNNAGTEPDGTIPLDTMAGQIKTFFSNAFGELWNQLQFIYSSFNPATATGASQDAVCSITGTTRNSKVYSQVTATCTGTPGTLISLGKVASVITAGSRFDAIAPGTITTQASWASTHAYVVGNRVTNASRVYQCITSGTSAGGGGPTSTASNITDGTVHWEYLGEGTGAIDIVFRAEVAGKIAALARTLSVIATPVSGWQTVTNLADAAAGNVTEPDADLRQKREDEVGASGNATELAIRGAVLKATADPQNLVTSCAVFYNDQDVTDANGVPPHSVEVLVLGGIDVDIAKAILASVAAGIRTYGTSNATVLDSANNSQTMYFTRPTAIPIYVRADVTYDPKKFPTDLTAGALLIKGALKTYGDTYPMGKSVRSSALEASVFDGPTSTDAGATPTPGVLDVTALYIKTSATPTAPTTIPITRRQLATFDTANMTINLLEGVP